MSELFLFDFGYGFLWNYGHSIAVLVFGLLFWAARRLKWPVGLQVAAAVGLLWGLVGLAIVQGAMRMNLPLELPTENFLAEGRGRVLDVGAGSGRTSIMALRARPESRMVALDLYEGYFGIGDNSPERLFENASRGGVRERIDSLTGDMRSMPIEDGSFDAVVSAFAIDHLDRAGLTAALSEVRRVLVPGGEFLLMVVHPDGWIRTAFPFFVHHGYFGGSSQRERWRADLEAAGFEVVEDGTTPGTLFLFARTRS